MMKSKTQIDKIISKLAYLIVLLSILALIVGQCTKPMPETTPDEWQTTPKESLPGQIISTFLLPIPAYTRLSLPEIEHIFYPYTFYLPITYGSVPPAYRDIVARYGGKMYTLPYEFNHLLADTHQQVTDDNRSSIARAFIWSSHWTLAIDLVRFEKEVVIDETDPQLPDYSYQLETQSWAREEGMLANWKFGFKGGQIEVVQRTLLGRRVGDSTEIDSFLLRLGRRGNTTYYICCDKKGNLMSSWRGIAPASGPGIPIESPTPTGAGWRIVTPKEIREGRLNKIARQVYPGYRVDEATLFVGSGGTAMRTMSRLFSSSTPVFYLIAPPFDEQWKTPLSYAGVLAIQGEAVYKLPEDFNLLLKDAGLRVTETNRVDVARAFIWAAHRELTGDYYLSEPQVINEVDSQFPVYRYQLEIQSWTRERGVWVKWKFGFQDGRIAVVQVSVLGRFTGKWTSRLHPYVIDPFYEEGVKCYVCCDEEGSLR